MKELNEQENTSAQNSPLPSGQVATPVDGTLVGTSGQAPKLEDRWTKPVILPKLDTNDPVALSIAEGTFWNEQMMEHAQFFIMLMPGAELADERGEAELFNVPSRISLKKPRVQNSTSATMRPSIAPISKF